MYDALNINLSLTCVVSEKHILVRDILCMYFLEYFRQLHTECVELLYSK